uniref:Uncharacterized protein n=1 Tax=Leptobrachium leishanense TaxID=445787 RepID=A0A8C5M9F4_9ANUR
MINRRRALYLLYFLLFVLLCAVIYDTYKKNQARLRYRLRTDTEPPWLPDDTCRDVERKIGIANIKTFNSDEIKAQIQYLQRCPWSVNVSTQTALRTELQACCNAGRYFLVTQENTRIGDNITYETRKDKHVEVTKKLHEIFPKTSPFLNKRIRSCAVVGSGGILLNSSCGSEIDQADYVFRFNLAPMNYSKDTGTRTNLVTANPSILRQRYAKLNEERRPFMNLVEIYESALIVMPAFSFIRNTDLSLKAFYTLEDFGSRQKVVYFHPNYLENLALFWKEKDLEVRRLSSGLMIVSAALEICNKVMLYGFWPFSEDPNGKPIPHHFYDDELPNISQHNMPDEFFFYSQMHSKGILKLKIGRCF